MNRISLGYEKGEKCNRDGCIGIIKEHDSESCCSCHINPPCSYCTDSRSYCPECDWDGKEEQDEIENQRLKQYKENPIDTFYKVRTMNDLDRTKIDYLSLSHTHFSMIKKGVFPEGTTREEVIEKVKGTFGGRFKYFEEDRREFEYVSYTD